MKATPAQKQATDEVMSSTDSMSSWEWEWDRKSQIILQNLAAKISVQCKERSSQAVMLDVMEMETLYKLELIYVDIV